jgi:pimeloyl-ACP methyl ester carboxylesterase
LVTRFASSERGEASFSEQPCRFGDGGKLFGILSFFGQQASIDKPVIVLLNAGSVHHVGPNRLYVSLARALALDKFTCFRMDLSGLGDSVASPSQRENHPYPDSSVTDTAEALRFLRRELGCKQFILMGLCSGAHTAFHTGVELDEFDIVETVLINPLTYRWVEGMTLETNTLRDFQAIAFSKDAIRDPRKWPSLLRRLLKVHRVAAILLGHIKRLGKEFLAFSRPSQLAQDLTKLLGRGRPLTLFVSRQDPGYDMLVAGARQLVRKARKSGRIQVHFIENADHTFTELGPRNELISQIRASCTRAVR